MKTNQKFFITILSCLFLLVFFGFSVFAEISEKDKYGGTLIVDQPYGDVENLDPIVRGRMGAMRVTMNIFDGLVKFNPNDASIEPAIAKRWTISEDGKLYTFYLRDDAYFHNGRKIKAADFVYSFERLVNPENGSPVSFYLDGVVGVKDFIEGKAKHISGIRAVDEYILQIELEAPNNGFISQLAWPGCSVVPKETVEELGKDFGMRPIVGSGPFKFVEYTPDNRVVLEAFEDYYAGRPYLDRVIYRLLPEAATKEAEFLNGNLDAFIMPASLYRKYKNHPQYSKQMIEVAEFFTRHIGFNCQKEPFDDVRVRQAFNYAIDTDAIINVILGGKGFKAVGYLPSSSFAFNENLKGYNYDPEKAKKLLKEAGYGNGVEVEIITSEHPEWGLQVVEAIMPFLSKVGIKLKPVVMDTGVLYDRLNSGDFVSYIYSTGGDPHPVDYLWVFHTDLSLDQYTRYSNPEVDKLLEKARVTSDTDLMIELLHKAEEIIVKEAPMYFFHYNKAVMIHQDYVHGLQPIPVDLALQDMSKVWLYPKPTR